VPDLVNQRRGDAVPDHAFPGNPNDRDRVIAAARQPGAGAPNRRADAPIQIADHRRRLIVATREIERVGGRHIQAGQPDPGLVFAALGDDVVKQIELIQHRVEAQTEEHETAVSFLPIDGPGGGTAQPAQIVLYARLQFVPTPRQDGLDAVCDSGSRFAAGSMASCRAKGLTSASRVSRARASCANIQVA